MWFEVCLYPSDRELDEPVSAISNPALCRCPFLITWTPLTEYYRNRGILDDISLEPRDCLELWKCMVEHQTEPYPVGNSLNPRNFLGEVAKKADVIKWETALKETLLQWMKDEDSPFPAICRGELEGAQP